MNFKLTEANWIKIGEDMGWLNEHMGTPGFSAESDATSCPRCNYSGKFRSRGDNNKCPECNFQWPKEIKRQVEI